MGKPTEVFRRLGQEVGSAKLALLALEALAAKRGIMSEGSYVPRIDTMLERKEIQFVSRLPKDEPSKPIDVRYGRIPRLGDKKTAIFLVIKGEWVDEKTSPRNREQGLEEMYAWLKALLEVTDYLRSQGEEIITGPEIKKAFNR